MKDFDAELDSIEIDGGCAMKTVSMQLVTVELENGHRGVFIGAPLVTDERADADCQVEEVWFSDIQDVPDEISLTRLIRMLQDQLCRCLATLQ
jgi:hypothetical protein